MGFFLSIMMILSSPMLVKNNMIQIAGIQFKVIINGDSDRRFIWVHGDEQTAKMALEDHISTNEGTAFLVQGIAREADFFGGMIDPNRIFSAEGAKKNIKKYNHDWPRAKTQEVLELLNKDRDAFLDQIFPKNGGLLVALHNNSKGYSIINEVPISDKVSIKPDQSPQNFYLCTNANDFDVLARSPFNVALQEKLPKEDNGSLSWAAVRQDVRYVNIETQLGWLSLQKKMLNYLEDHLK